MLTWAALKTKKPRVEDEKRIADGEAMNKESSLPKKMTKRALETIKVVDSSLVISSIRGGDHMFKQSRQ